MTLVSLKEKTEVSDYHDAAQVYPFTRWTPNLVNWIREGDESRFFREPSYSAFEVLTLDLQLARDRWIVKWPEHPEVSFEDIRLGRLPKIDPKELGVRQNAIKAARETRQKLNIAPLTTSTIIRQLRNGTEKG